MRATLDAGLIFTRTVDDLPVIGPGGMAMVKVGTDEAVVGGREIWRPVLRRASQVNLRTPDEAVDLLRGQMKTMASTEKSTFARHAWAMQSSASKSSSDLLRTVLRVRSRDRGGSRRFEKGGGGTRRSDGADGRGILRCVNARRAGLAGRRHA